MTVIAFFASVCFFLVESVSIIFCFFCQGIFKSLELLFNCADIIYN